jgi:class 3 adenylate cyclase
MNKADSFVLILRNETIFQSQMKQAKDVKEQNEGLLYSILLKDLVSRMIQGEKEIRFSIQSATAIFIDISKFSEFSKGFTFSQVMETLSTIFSNFDSICGNYDLITKIKLIGDIYMVAGDIFNQGIDPSLHAQQVVQFGLDYLSAIEDLNQNLNGSLRIRIGINTGGPLIAEIIGTERQIFDIFGPVINVAVSFKVQVFLIAFKFLNQLMILFEI